MDTADTSLEKLPLLIFLKNRLTESDFHCSMRPNEAKQQLRHERTMRIGYNERLVMTRIRIS